MRLPDLRDDAAEERGVDVGVEEHLRRGSAAASFVRDALRGGGVERDRRGEVRADAAELLVGQAPNVSTIAPRCARRFRSPSR